MSALEENLLLQIKAEKLTLPDREYKFHPTRRWRFDFAWPEIMLAVEVEGGIWIQGRHSRGAGMSADMEKYNEAVKLGWRVLRFDSKAIKSGNAITTIKEVINV